MIELASGSTQRISSIAFANALQGVPDVWHISVVT